MMRVVSVVVEVVVAAGFVFVVVREVLRRGLAGGPAGSGLDDIDGDGGS